MQECLTLLVFYIHISVENYSFLCLSGSLFWYTLKRSKDIIFILFKVYALFNVHGT